MGVCLIVDLRYPSTSERGDMPDFLEPDKLRFTRKNDDTSGCYFDSVMGRSDTRWPNPVHHSANTKDICSVAYLSPIGR